MDWVPRNLQPSSPSAPASVAYFEMREECLHLRMQLHLNSNCQLRGAKVEILVLTMDRIVSWSPVFIGGFWLDSLGGVIDLLRIY